MDGSVVMAESAIVWPFKFNATGFIEHTYDQRKMWRDRIILVVLTSLGERVMLPNYGTLVPKSVFENEQAALEMCRTTITEAFSKWFPTLMFNDLTGILDNSTGYFDLEIYYADVTGVQDSVRIRTATFTRFGDIINEVTSG
jgi:phage baseplate assembly protein W